jgi:hypothetical protein
MQPYQEPVEQPCPVCGQLFTPSGFFRGEFCNDCTVAALKVFEASTVMVQHFNKCYVRSKETDQS